MANDPDAKRLLWFVFAASRGGLNRLKIISKLKENPLNINQLAKELGLDYKAIQHSTSARGTRAVSGSSRTMATSSPRKSSSPRALGRESSPHDAAKRCPWKRSAATMSCCTTLASSREPWSAWPARNFSPHPWTRGFELPEPRSLPAWMRRRIIDAPRCCEDGRGSCIPR